MTTRSLTVPAQPEATKGLNQRVWVNFVVLALTTAWLAVTLGLRPLANPDEGRYVGVAWEILRSGDWLAPTINGLPFFHKPPLFYWITAGSLATFGANEWAARVGPLIGAVIGATALFRFSQAWLGRDRALMATGVLLLLPMFFLASQYANHDMLVAGFIGAATLSFAHGVLLSLKGNQRAKVVRFIVFGWALAACGVLTKGLIGIVLPVAVIGFWLLWIAQLRAARWLLHPLGLLAFALIALPWFVAVAIRYEGFLEYFILDQHIRRFTSSGFNNTQPMWFYVAVLALLNLPWTLWLVSRARIQPLVNAKPVVATEPDIDRLLNKLMITWLLVILLFFSIPSSKLIGYILPVLAPLAFLIADRINRVVPVPLDSKHCWTSVSFALFVSLGVVFGMAMKYDKTTNELGAFLGKSITPGESVVFLNQYYFDLAFYAGLREPVLVADHWQDWLSQPSDSWRKELWDSQRFNIAGAPERLIEVSELGERFTPEQTIWLVGPHQSGKTYCWLAPHEPVHRSNRATLWRLNGADMNRINCESEKPSADSAKMWPLPRAEQREATRVHTGLQTSSVILRMPPDSNPGQMQR